MIAILIVVIVGSLNDWQKERQFRKLNDKKEDRGVKVIRDGKEQVINVKASYSDQQLIPTNTCANYVGGHGWRYCTSRTW